ncbi:MAG: DEAD/DEAH box helicase [Bacteroidota bacterium]|nr:DEAD/DEAH box helicase [Bacteroidota bacterium]
MQKKEDLVSKSLKNLGIKTLKEMQEASIRANDKNDNVILLAPTGTGKTLGFLIPILKRLKPNVKGIQALIISPSRELSIQIEQVFRAMKTDYKINAFYGGHAMKIEKNSLLEPPAVLVGTPGRIAGHIRQETFKTSSIKTLVLDEFDKSLELGFQEDMRFIIQKIPDVKSKILTSATKSDSIPPFLMMRDPIVLNYIGEIEMGKLKLRAVRSQGSDKLKALFNLTCKIGTESTLIFCNHREAVDRISELLKEKELDHDIFHGGLEQHIRERALIKFRNGSYNILITTDLASRGLDIPEIKNIIHYQLPTGKGAYIHRNGRTARMNANGSSYLVLAESEPVPNFIKEEPAFIDIADEVTLPKAPKWQTLYISGGKKDKINKIDIVGLMLKKGELNKEDLGLIEVLDHISYIAVNREKAFKTMMLLKKAKIKKQTVKIAFSR